MVDKVALQTEVLAIARNKWTFVGLAINKTGEVESEPDNYNVYSLKVFKDDEEFITTCEEVFELYNSNVIVGRKYAQTLTTSLFEPYYSAYPLLGQIEMMISKNSYCTLEEISDIRNNISLTTISTGYNEFGLEINKTIEIDNSDIVTKTNSYKNRSDDSGVDGDATYKSSYINKEEFTFNGSSLTREYELDDVGNVTSITNSNSLFTDHEYDYRGYLIKDNDEEYEYDDNGNITLCGTNQYEYTDTNKDKLTKACGHNVLYNANYGLNPESWNGRNYSWLGRRLLSYQYNNILSVYSYNEAGLRSSKTVDGVTTNYFYDVKK